ncbi:MAG TPA: hypothetical protein VND88_04085 [Candidatus Acidoferrales bacterium]|nr:hypothetical protein [Candidatus Acidoferrales bacterium]
MLSDARDTVQRRRHGARFGDEATAVCSAYLGAAKAVDAAQERRRAVQLRRGITYAEDQAVERECAEAWEQCFLAAVELDTVLPDPEHEAAALVRSLASLFGVLEGDWNPYLGPDGARGYTDGRGRCIAAFIGDQVIPGPWFMEGQPLPEAPGTQLVIG